MADQLYEKLKETAIGHIHAFESTSGPTGSPFDPDNVYAHRTPTSEMRLHPGSSMPPPFDGTVSRKEHAPMLLTLGALMESVKCDIHEITIDVKTRVAIVRMTANYVFKAVKEDPKTVEYPIEYVWITEMNESGEKIVRMEEWLDTTRAGWMISRAMKYAEENGKGQ